MKYRHGEKGENAENEKNLLIPVQVEFKEDVGIYSGRVFPVESLRVVQDAYNCSRNCSCEVF